LFERRFIDFLIVRKISVARQRLDTEGPELHEKFVFTLFERTGSFG
jgi:hypothetical protein